MTRSKVPRSRRSVHVSERPAGTPSHGDACGGVGGVGGGEAGDGDGAGGRGVSNHPGGEQEEDHGSPTFTAGTAPMVPRQHSSTIGGSSHLSSVDTEITDIIYPESDGAWRIPDRQGSVVDPRRISTGSVDSVDMAVVRIPEQDRFMAPREMTQTKLERNGSWIPADDQDDVADRGVINYPQHLNNGIRTRNGKQLAKFPSKDGHKGATKKAMNFTIVDLLINLVSIGSYLADVGSDLFVAYMYYSSGKWWWFGLTLGFVFIPSIIMTMFSLKWYVADHQVSRRKISKIRWASRVTFLMLQLAPVLRYVDTLLYGLRSRQENVNEMKKHWYDQMLFEDTDSAMLRLFECFMEAAPQLCLQLYIMCVMGPGATSGSNLDGPIYHLLIVGQIISSLTSMVSIAWAMCSYHRSLRLSLDTMHNMSYPGVAVQFLWHFFTIGSRVIAISLFASYFNRWIFVLAGAHWCAMLVWILIQNTSFCKAKWEEFFFDVVAACVYIFCYFNLTEGHTRLRYLFYYTVVYSENAAMILAWYLFTQTHDIWYHSYGLATVLVGFVIGIMFQIIYYLKLHPNNLCGDKSKRIPLWRPLHELVGDAEGNSTMEMSDMAPGRRSQDYPDSSNRNVNNRYHHGDDSDSTECGRPLMGDFC